MGHIDAFGHIQQEPCQLDKPQKTAQLRGFSQFHRKIQTWHADCMSIFDPAISAGTEKEVDAYKAIERELCELKIYIHALSASIEFDDVYTRQAAQAVVTAEWHAAHPDCGEYSRIQAAKLPAYRAALRAALS